MKPSTPQANLHQKVKLVDMSARYFEGRRGPDGNRQYRIVCSSCGVSTQITSKTLLKADAIVGQFTTRKWMVGLTPSDDLCPACVLRKKQELQRQIDRMNEMPKDVVVPIKAEPPREMQRSDRQVIWGKLQDVYPKEDAGYLEGWSDDRLAKDLGVPRAWVAKVRDENFGPVVTVDVEALRRENVQLWTLVHDLHVKLNAIAAKVRDDADLATEARDLVHAAVKTKNTKAA